MGDNFFFFVLGLILGIAGTMIFVSVNIVFPIAHAVLK